MKRVVITVNAHITSFSLTKGLMRVWFPVCKLSCYFIIFIGYCKKFRAPFILESISKSDAWLPLPGSITIRMMFQHPAVEWALEIHNREHFIWPMIIVSSFSCFFSFSALLEMLFWKNVHGSLFSGSVKRSLNFSIGMAKHVNRSLAESEACTIHAQPMNLHTPGSTVHLTCRSWKQRRRRSSRFDCFFFSFCHLAITLAPCGESKGHSEGFFSGSGLATQGSGL